MTADELEAGPAHPDPNTLSTLTEGVPLRDELLKRWASVLLAQYGDETATYIQERRRARAAQGDPVGVDEWTDVGAIVCGLMGLNALPGDESVPTNRAGDAQAEAPASASDEWTDAPIWSEWTFWVILGALAVGMIMLVQLVRHIWAAL